MSRNLLLTVLVTALATALAVLGALYDTYRPPIGEPVTPAAAVTIPDFTVKTLDGRSISTQDLRGKVVILNFWATWCAPCVVEFPTLIHLTAKYKGQVVLLALSSDRTRDVVDRFLSNIRKITGPAFDPNRVLVAMDQNRALTRDVFKVKTYPESLIIAPDGTVARHIIGIDAWDDPDTLVQINNLLPGTPPSP